MTNFKKWKIQKMSSYIKRRIQTNEKLRKFSWKSGTFLFEKKTDKETVRNHHHWNQ